VLRILLALPCKFSFAQAEGSVISLAHSLGSLGFGGGVGSSSVGLLDGEEATVAACCAFFRAALPNS